MFWVALATLIMMLSGDGDDTTAITSFLDALHKSASAQIRDPDRRASTLTAIDSYQALFREHRAKQNELAKCAEKADRNYHATLSTYEDCMAAVAAHWRNLRFRLDAIRVQLEKNVRPEEVAAMERDLQENVSAERVLQRAGQQTGPASPSPPRPRGLEGIAAQRNLTVPRNSLSLIFGPGLTPTFAQRFAAGPIEAGLVYRRLDSSGQASEEWMLRGGVMFGLFDDFEAGALFIPVELSPDPHFDDVTVLLTQNFRFKNIDLAARFSFRTPANVGWGLNPGIAARYRPSPKVAVDLAIQMPFELGSRSSPQAPLVALQVPVRATWNLSPHLFLIGSSGFAYDNMASSATAMMPLGAGAGYTFLFGKRLIDLTATFDWEGLLRFSPLPQQQALDPGSYHLALGFTFHSQAL